MEASLDACRHEHKATGARHDSVVCTSSMSHPLTLLDRYITVHKPSGNAYSYLSGEEARTRKPEFSKLGHLYVPLLLDSVWAPKAGHGCFCAQG